jgi:chaperonin cofactor prefoldin
MGKMTSISVEESTRDRFNRLKAELDEQQNAPDHTANSFLSALLDTWEAVDDGHYQDVNADLIADELKQEIDSLTFDGAVFKDEAERIMARIDELESRIPKRTADELEGRRR